MLAGLDGAIAPPRKGLGCNRLEFLRVLRPGGYTFFQVATAAKDGAATVPGPRPNDEPVIEIYALDPDEIQAVVAAGAAQIVREAEDDWAGPDWISRHYTVQRL